MKKILSVVSLLIVVIILFNCGSTKQKKTVSSQPQSDGLFLIQTKFGDMTVQLFDETPLHKANFERLVADSFYNGTLFHRVIDGFMIQGGDPDSKNARAGQRLGMGNLKYTVPAEFNRKLIHKKGALAAARQSDQVNPKKASSGSQFYIVQGKTVDQQSLNMVNKRKNIMLSRTLSNEILNDSNNLQLKNSFKRVNKTRNTDSIAFYRNQLQTLIDSAMALKQYEYTPEQIAIYDSIGGTPQLDFEYTVFGEVIKGLDIIDSIARVQRDRADRPIEDIKMTIKKL